MPTVHGVSMSPFVRKVQILLECKGADYDLNPLLPINPPAHYLAKSRSEKSRATRTTTSSCLIRP